MNRPFIGVNGARDREDDEALVDPNWKPATAKPAHRTVSAVARDIRKEWGDKVNYAAKPYLQAMLNDDYGHDGQKSVVLYFLSNASAFRGGNAAALKAELKTICGVR